MTRLTLPLAVVFLLTFQAGCGGSVDQDSPGYAATEFYQKLANGGIEEASEYIAGDVVAMVGRDKLNMMLRDYYRDIRESGGLESIEVLNQEITGDLATVSLRSTYGNGESTEEIVEMTRIGDEWKLLMDMEDK